MECPHSLDLADNLKEGIELGRIDSQTLVRGCCGPEECPMKVRVAALGAFPLLGDEIGADVGAGGEGVRRFAGQSRKKLFMIKTRMLVGIVNL